MKSTMKKNGKVVIYQVFTRLFGNTNTTNKPWGTIEENGVGKFSDFNDLALQEIKNLGVTHIWYTGIPHHAVIRDYTEFGISNDDPDVVKGRAGSPYAVKDYYNVNPDLAQNPALRLQEFEALVKRTHKAGLRLIIDIVPNHVARKYESISRPEGTADFGENDDTNLVYHKNNDFYYIPGERFKIPQWASGYLPLGGEENPLVGGTFDENPAKWTGNGSRAAQPSSQDWYETVKVNYGIDPEGRKDFPELPPNFEKENFTKHHDFWENQMVPSSWKKFKSIALFWLSKGVDGFRYDMAEMVPVEFWSYLNSAIKSKNPDAFLLAEVYRPELYREYLFKGKMDYLYDKVELYDSLKHVMQGYGWTDHIPVVQKQNQDIEHHLLHFLENHDEQRIASGSFAGDAKKGMPAMVVSATLGTSPTMIYFGQEVGEDASEKPGFGSPSRTSIFDYVGVPAHQRWVNKKKFDGGQLSKEEVTLRDFYKRLLNITISSPALMGKYREIHFYNKQHTEHYDHKLLSYVRYTKEEKLIILANFNEQRKYNLNLKLPADISGLWELSPGKYRLTDLLYGSTHELVVTDESSEVFITLKPLQSYILKVQAP